jgi:hypothetical protein
MIARAQTADARGALVGRVTDPSGAVVPGAEIRATNVATGVVASTRTNEAGNHALPFLVPGVYTVTAELAGFKKFVRENVQIRVNDSVELNIQMALGDVTEAVQVTAETPLLQTAEASLGQVVDERRITELPLFAGNAMDLVHLAPGTVNGTDMRLRKAPFNAAPSQFSTDGSGNYGNFFTIDGVPNVYSDGTSPRVAFSPPTASLSEFKVQTSSFDASVGRTLGGAGKRQHQRRNQHAARAGLVVVAQFRLRLPHHLPEPFRPANPALHGQPLRAGGWRPGLFAQALQRQKPHVLVLHLGG